jgi:hypothetical protein
MQNLNKEKPYKYKVLVELCIKIYNQVKQTQIHLAMTVKESWCIPVCELVACVDPELQAGADRLYYCTIHPRHHRVAKVDLSQTQIQ